MFSIKPFILIDPRFLFEPIKWVFFYFFSTLRLTKIDLKDKYKNKDINIFCKYLFLKLYNLFL